MWRFLKNLRINLPYDPANPLLGIYLEKIIIEKDTYTPMFIVAVFTIAKIQTNQMASDRRTGKKNVSYTQNGLYSFTKEGNPTIHDNMGERGRCYAK